jgi:cyanophycinase
VSVHLIGGGWAEDEAAWTGRFVAEARDRAERRPTIAVVLWAETAAEGESWHDEYRADLGAHDCEVRFVQLAADRVLEPADLTGADGIFVGGGLTPGYHAAIMPAAQAIRELVADGTPYAGFSAGAMIAGDVALLGGWRIGGVEVTQERSSEGLDEVTLVEGLGLVDVVVDVHAAQYGNLGRAVAIVDAELADRAVAIDERTSLVAGAAALVAAGEGNVYVCSKDGPHVQVTVLGGR